MQSKRYRPEERPESPASPAPIPRALALAEVHDALAEWLQAKAEQVPTARSHAVAIMAIFDRE